MKMTRLEAIKAWGRASREGKPIPEEVREVLNSTQNDTRYDLHVEAPAAKVRISKEQEKKDVTGKKLLTAPAFTRNVGGALTAEQMEIYNKKRKLDNLKRKHNPQIYSNLMFEFLASGLSKNQAAKKARNIIQRETLERFNNKKSKLKVEIIPSKKNKVILGKEKIKFDPWHAAKFKQAEINQDNHKRKKIETALTKRPISCIECKIDFKFFGVFVDHTRDVHHASVSTPKLISYIEKHVVAPDVLSELPVLFSNEGEGKVFSFPVLKAPESFSEKWIRLFAENGYTVAMVDAFKREANKQGMDIKKAHEFLSVCKPSKHFMEMPARPLTEMISNAIANVIEMPLGSGDYDPSSVPAISESIEQALFANRIVRARTNQGDFKERVAANFSYQCAITNSGEALEAAHIDPVGTGNNNTSNGVLMLACLHRLFDNGLMAINPEFLTVHFKPHCTYFAKNALEGKKLNSHSVPLNKSGLLERWLRFGG